MRTPIKLGAYALALAAVFAAALGLGRVAGPGRATATPAHSNVHDSTGTAVGGHDSGAAPHVLVRRDLSGFQHVHPILGPDGTWALPLAVSAPGQYRVLADFQPVGRDEGSTLGVEVPAPGDYQPAALPAPARTATVDGYTVTLEGELAPGTASKLTLSVTKGGAPVTDLQPYLGGYGHLVALRDGDLAYLHVHPDGTAGDGRTAARPQVTFVAEVPSAGAYRLYLDFRHAGKVRTAEFTAIVGQPVRAVAVPHPTTPAPSAERGDPAHTHR
jgi:hypothetical protein